MDAWGRHLWQLTVGRRPLGGGGGGAGVVGVLGPAESPPPGSASSHRVQRFPQFCKHLSLTISMELLIIYLCQNPFAFVI